MADKVIVVKEHRTGCGCGFLALILIVGVIGFLVYTWGQAENREMERREAFEKSQRGKSVTEQSPVRSSEKTATPSDVWRVAQHRDEITDAVSYLLVLDGLRISEGIIDYVPRLVIALPQTARLSGDFSDAECYVNMDVEAIRRDGVVADVRINSDPAEKVCLTPSQNRHAAFLPKDYVKRLDGARTLIVRLETSLGNVRTYKFNLQGVSFYTLAKKLKRETSAQ